MVFNEAFEHCGRKQDFYNADAQRIFIHSTCPSELSTQLTLSNTFRSVKARPEL